MLSMMITDPAVNKDRLIRICLVHDLAESIVGDIVPHDVRVNAQEKRRLEEAAMRKIATDLDHSEISQELLELWLEYEACETPEAVVAKNLDKYEMIVQADEYEREQGHDLSDFFASTKQSFSHPEVLAWAEELWGQRDKRRAS